MTRFVLAFFLGVGLLITAKGAEKAKLPPLEEREKAAKLIRDLFKAEYAKTTVVAKGALADTLFKQASESDQDLPAKYVLLKEAAELAAGSNIELSVQACETLIKSFDGPAGEVIEPILKSVAPKAVSPAAAQSLASFVLKVVDDTLADDDFETAGRLQKMADGLAQRSKNLKLIKQVQSLAKDIDLSKQIIVKVNDAFTVLKDKPEDPDANLLVGKYACFNKGDWPKGLPLLAKGSDAKLKAAAAKDLEATAEDATSSLAAGDGWYDLVTSIEGHPKTNIYFRIHTHYTNALPKATGITKTKVEKRLEEVEKSLDGKWDYPNLWPVVKAAIRNKSYDKAGPAGGAFGDKEYSELIPEGGVLIGFNYTLRTLGNKNVIDCFQPIYMTTTGEKLGTAMGNFKDPKAGKMLTLKAKSNYAISKMKLRGGGLWEGVNVTFMKIDNKGNFKTDDTYESAAIGFTDVFGDFVGDSRPIIGIHGKLQPPRDGGGVCSFGVYLAGEKPKK